MMERLLPLSISVMLLLSLFITGIGVDNVLASEHGGGVSEVVHGLKQQEGGVGDALRQQSRNTNSGVGNGGDAGETEMTDSDPGFSGGTYTPSFEYKNQAGKNVDKPQSPASD